MRRRADEKEKSGGGVGQLFIFPDGVSINFLEVRKRMELDILPYVLTKKGHPDTKDGVPAVGDVWGHRTFGMHRNVGPEDKTYICPKMTFGLPCPICEEVARLSKDFNTNKETIKAIKVKERQLFNVIDLDEEDKGVQLLHISHFLFGKLLDEEIREGEEALAEFYELQGGSTLTIRMKEGDFKTSDGKAILQASRIDFAEREDYDEKVLDETLALDNFLNVPSYEELEKAFLDLDDEGSSEEVPPDEVTKEVDWNSKDEGKEEGRSSRGRSRRGRGEDPPPPEEEKPTGRGRRSSTRERPAGKAESNKCVDNEGKPLGGTFGISTDDIDACDNCGKWEACRDAKDAKDAK